MEDSQKNPIGLSADATLRLTLDRHLSPRVTVNRKAKLSSALRVEKTIVPVYGMNAFTDAMFLHVDGRWAASESIALSALSEM